MLDAFRFPIEPAAFALLLRIEIEALGEPQSRRENITNHLLRHAGVFETNEWNVARQIRQRKHVTDTGGEGEDRFHPSLAIEQPCVAITGDHVIRRREIGTVAFRPIDERDFRFGQRFGVRNREATPAAPRRAGGRGGPEPGGAA